MADRPTTNGLRKRILIVEDDDEVGPTLVRFLAQEGYVVDLATTVAVAWERLCAKQYGLVIADWKLPDGSGLSIADVAEQGGAKSIVMSGYLFERSSDRADAQEILMKPIRPSEMLAVTRQAIGEP